MALKIRLWQQGCKNNICYRVVVANSQSPRDGKYVEAIGWFDRRGKTVEQKSSIKADRLLYWLSVGAQMSDTVAAVAKQTVPAAVQEFEQTCKARAEKKVAARRAKA